MSRYLSRVQVISQEGIPFGYFVGCTAYLDNGQLTVMLRHRCNTRVRRSVPLIELDPPTIAITDPQNYEGFVPLPRGRVLSRRL
jgi:hypothetical protein